jgi:Na+/H+-dicarboxylate symporter
VGSGVAALERMQTIWQLLLTGMGVVMITTTIAVIIGLCVLLWWTHRID